MAKVGIYVGVWVWVWVGRWQHVNSNLTIMVVVIQSFPKSEHYHFTGEFGIVYKAELAKVGMHSSSITVAVKTLKG